MSDPTHRVRHMLPSPRAQADSNRTLPALLSGEVGAAERGMTRTSAQYDM